MERRRFLAACGLAVTTTAGCLGPAGGDTPSDGHETPKTDSPPSPSDVSGDAPPTGEDPMDDPDDDLAVGIENRSNETRTITLTVSRESGETVYEETHEVEAGTDRDVYNLREADPDGVESFVVTAEIDGTEESATVQTSECYGDAFVAIAEDGDFYVTYAVC
jgi:hypothetical protein